MGELLADGTKSLIAPMTAGLDVRFGAVVTRVTHDGSGVTAMLDDGTSIGAEAAVIALPLNVWAAMERMGGEDSERAERLAPLVAERTRLDRDSSALPDPALLERHLEETSAHLARISQRLLEDLPGHAADLATAG